MKKLWILLVALMMLVCLSAQAETAALLTGSGSFSAETAKETGDPAAGYIHDLMYHVSRRGDTASAQLEGSARRLYDYLRPLIIKIAAGQRSSTVFTPDASEIYTGYSEMSSQVAEDVDTVINALMLDLPYDLYWFDKVTGWSWSYGWDSLEISLNVAEAYRKNGDPLAVNPKYGKAARKAADNAAGIVSAHAGEDDGTKLMSYKNEICNLVSYNYDAAYNLSMPYGDPWQLVWVFDGDASTNVVCEGYSKAFQYLCDLSTFQSKKVKAICVNGLMVVGGGGGRHMWNIVTLGNGLRYLVDVTNCDAGMIGAPNALFLAGYSSGDYKSGYTYYAGGSTVTYIYETEYGNMATLLGVDEVLMVNANGEQPETGPAQSATIGGLKYKLSGSSATVTGPKSKSAAKLTIPATVKYKGKSYKVTAVKARAFKGMKQLTSLVIGKNVKSIGKSAFAGCAALKTITIKTSKLTAKTVGANAFKGIAKKATVKVPAKKLKAYRTLLVKRGVPKTAKFKK